ncbi:hypothetical protein J1614_000752 [Plenodomus biglobosus]|nr:hypothetical protein J1614_000752 [Plenodomus biglobosus]
MFILLTLVDSARTRGCLLYQTTYSRVLPRGTNIRQLKSKLGDATLGTVLSETTHTYEVGKDPISVELRAEVAADVSCCMSKKHADPAVNTGTPLSNAKIPTFASFAGNPVKRTIREIRHVVVKPDNMLRSTPHNQRQCDDVVPKDEVPKRLIKSYLQTPENTSKPQPTADA